MNCLCQRVGNNTVIFHETTNSLCRKSFFFSIIQFNLWFSNRIFNLWLENNEQQNSFLVIVCSVWLQKLTSIDHEFIYRRQVHIEEHTMQSNIQLREREAESDQCSNVRKHD